jgi:predicted GNAT family N-acyltransferase
LIERARSRGMRRVVLNAQTHAAPFYARFGFAAVGAEFMEAGIPHVEMARAL